MVSFSGVSPHLAFSSLLKAMGADEDGPILARFLLPAGKSRPRAAAEAWVSTTPGGTAFSTIGVHSLHFGGLDCPLSYRSVMTRTTQV